MSTADVSEVDLRPIGGAVVAGVIASIAAFVGTWSLLAAISAYLVTAIVGYSLLVVMWG